MNKLLKLFLLMALTSCLHAKTNHIGGGMSVSPQSMLLTSRKTTGTFTVRNSGKEKLSVEISRADMLMQDDGTYKYVDKSPVSIGKNLRFSPRKITIMPGEQQKVRVMLRNPRKFQNHEFGSRIIFTAVAEKNKKELPKKNVHSVEFVLNLQLAINMPVAYRPDNIKYSNVITKDITSEFKDDKLFIKYTDIRTAGDTTITYKTVIEWINPDNSIVKLNSVKGMTVSYPSERVYRKLNVKDYNLIKKLDKNGKVKITNTPTNIPKNAL